MELETVQIPAAFPFNLLDDGKNEPVVFLHNLTSLLTPALPFNTSDTVDGDTPASFAISCFFTRIPPPVKRRIQEIGSYKSNITRTLVKIK